MPTDTKVREINLPDWCAWEWTGESWTDDLEVFHPGLRHQLLWDRHNHGFTYCSQREADGQWVNTKCQHPKMQNVSNLNEARDVAEWFINEEDN